MSPDEADHDQEVPHPEVLEEDVLGQDVLDIDAPAPAPPAVEAVTATGGSVLVACMGNLLRGDDGFGVAVARELTETDLPDAVDVVEVGISGVSMAQELLSGYEAMVLVDAMEYGGEPGTLYVERAEVPDLDGYSRREIGSFAADMHQTDPAKVLVLGEALGVLPDPTVLVGCEPLETDDLADELSEPVRAAVPEAREHIGVILDELGVSGGDLAG